MAEARARGRGGRGGRQGSQHPSTGGPARLPRPRQASRAELVMAVVRQDSTFASARLGGQQVWLGRCLHCRSPVVVHHDGSCPPTTTLEHIEPRHHGGSDAPSNLALACRRCNHLKGTRIDRRRADDPAYLRTVAQLRAERERRLTGSELE